MNIHGEPWKGEEKIIYLPYLGRRKEICGWVEGNLARGKEGVALSGRELTPLDLLGLSWKRWEECRKASASSLVLFIFHGNQIKDRSSFLFPLLCTGLLDASIMRKGTGLPQSRMTGKVTEEEGTGPSCRSFTLASDRKECRQWLKQVGVLVAAIDTGNPEHPLHYPSPYLLLSCLKGEKALCELEFQLSCLWGFN